MKLIEKKCPKCGADLSFDINSKEVTCNYCKTSFEIDRSDDISNLVNEASNLVNGVINPDIFKLHAKMSKGITFVGIFIFAIALIIFLVIAFTMFSRFPF